MVLVKFSSVGSQLVLCLLSPGRQPWSSADWWRGEGRGETDWSGRDGQQARQFHSDQSGREHFLIRVRDSKDGGLVGDISTKILGVTRPGQD